MTLKAEIERLNPDQLARLNALELASVIRGLKAVVTQLQGPEFAVQNFTTLDAVTIQDTADHDSPDLVDMRQAVNYGFQIHNQTDQVMTFRVIGSTSNLGVVGTLGDPYPVAANSTDFVAVPEGLWLPYVGARVSYTTAPTTGTATIVMARRERTWVPSV